MLHNYEEINLILIFLQKDNIHTILCIHFFVHNNYQKYWYALLTGQKYLPRYINNRYFIHIDMN